MGVVEIGVVTDVLSLDGATVVEEEGVAEEVSEEANEGANDAVPVENAVGLTENDEVGRDEKPFADGAAVG